MHTSYEYYAPIQKIYVKIKYRVRSPVRIISFLACIYTFPALNISYCSRTSFLFI